jgi:hypothetical protein
VIDTLIWGISFVLMCFGLGGGAFLCVRTTEKGKNQRLAEVEKTKRQGMDNAWQLERERLLNGQALGTGKVSEVSFDLSGGDGSWK